jgi:hypothetical protein
MLTAVTAWTGCVSSSACTYLSSGYCPTGMPTMSPTTMMPTRTPTISPTTPSPTRTPTTSPTVAITVSTESREGTTVAASRGGGLA